MNELFRLVGLVVIKNDEAKKGLDDTVDHANKTSGKLGGAFKTIAKVGVAGAVALATGIGALTKKAIDNYAEYEQLVGGIDTLFKDSSNKVLQYANNAYKTAGMSANQYMEMVTSFSASLLQGLNGDTAKSAEIADMAITDMADNANKMGTSMEMIQNAYQGFSKQNYTLLDNLKLGYGGTKTEMERLLADAEKLSGIKYDISNLADVYSAIHVIQQEMGITGTTAKEASSTIQGSMMMLKASWENLMTGFADPSQDIGVLMQNVVDSAVTVANNLIPRIASTIPNIISGMGTLISTVGKALPSLFAQLVPVVVSGGKAIIKGFVDTIGSISNNLGAITGKIATFMGQIGTAIQTNLPIIVNKALDLVQGFVLKIGENLPTLIQAGMNLLNNIATGIMNSLPSLISKVPTIVISLCNALDAGLPKLLAGGIKLIVTLGKGLIQAIPTLIANIPKIIYAIVRVFQTFQWMKLGKNLIKSIGDGIKSLKNALPDMIKGITAKMKQSISSAWSAIKNLTSTVWNTIKNAVTKPFSSAKGVVSTIASTIRGSVINVWNSIKSKTVSTWNSIKSAIMRPIESAKNFVKSAINKIKGFFNFSWSLPKLKLPHISIKGGFSLIPPKAPKFSIKWYADGGIMEKPTMFGYDALSNTAHVGGEAGAEAIAPIDTLLGYVKTAVNEENKGLASSIDRLIDMLSQFLPEILSNMDKNIVLDGGALVGKLSGHIDAELGNINRLKGRGR